MHLFTVYANRFDHLGLKGLWFLKNRVGSVLKLKQAIKSTFTGFDTHPC